MERKSIEHVTSARTMGIILAQHVKGCQTTRPTLNNNVFIQLLWPSLVLRRSFNSIAGSTVSSSRPKLMDLLMLAAQPMLCSWKHFLKPRPWKYDEIWIGRALTQDGVLHPEEQNTHFCVCVCMCVCVNVCVRVHVCVCAVRFYNLSITRHSTYLHRSLQFATWEAQTI